MEVTVNTTNNENAKITLDEKALTSLIKDLAGSKPTQDYTVALNALNNLVQNKANECQNVMTLADLDKRDAIVKPVATSFKEMLQKVKRGSDYWNTQANETTTPAQATTQAPVEEATTAEPEKECPTVKKEGNADMEEIKRNIVLMELTKLKLQLGESSGHKVVEMALRYIEDNYNSTKLVVSLTKLRYTEKEMYKSVMRMLEPMKKIGYSKFDEIYTIISDIDFYC